MTDNLNNIDTKEASILFDAGALISLNAVPAPLNPSCWMLLVFAKNRKEPYVLAAQREPVRLFKSADAVISTANKIGFKNIKFTF